MASTTERVHAADGTELLARHWPASDPPAWSTVLIVHGLAEHSGRYEHVGSRLVDAGAEVASYDQRGFGASGGPRAYVEDWSQLHDDLEGRLAAARASADGRPVAIYGHSLGALVTLGCALTDRAQADAYVLSAPAIADGLPAWQRVVARVLNGVAPRTLIANAFDGSVLSRDPTVGERYLADPLTFRKTSVRFGRLAFREQDRVVASLDRLDRPTLVIHGGDDRLVPTVSSEPLAKLPVVTRRVLPGLRHEVHNEPEGPEVVDDIAAWLRSTLAEPS
jgi:alpha-beta hydrolase superfamily lysophospholipase